MDSPLTKWYCDICDHPIKNIEDGYVIWKSKANILNSQSLKIIHKVKCDLPDHHASNALKYFIGEEGLAYLLSKLSYGLIWTKENKKSDCSISDMDKFIDFIRRVQVPYYEEARRYFDNPDLQSDFAGGNPISPYIPNTLKNIIEKYGTTNVA